MKIGKYYQEGRYSRELIEIRNSLYPEKARLFEKMIVSYTPQKVLDVGCGDGGLIAYLQEKMGFQGYGVDISRKGTALAIRRGIESKVADIEEGIPFSNNMFDLIIANEIIEHLRNPDYFLEEVRRILRKGGMLLIGTPNLSVWFNRIIFPLGIYPVYLEASTQFRKIGMGFLKNQVTQQPVGHIRVFNLPALRDLLTAYGYEITEIRGTSVPFESSNKLLSLFYKTIDTMLSYIPSLASDLIILARRK